MSKLASFPRFSNGRASLAAAIVGMLVTAACAKIIGADFTKRDPPPETRVIPDDAFPADDVPSPDVSSPISDPPLPDDDPFEDDAGLADAGTPGICIPGEVRCDGAVPQSCNPSGSWRSLTSCASASLCAVSDESVKCLPEPCYEGQLRCRGSALESCDASDFSWRREQTCVSAAHCSTRERACTPSPCVANTAQCSGSEVQVCRAATGKWEVDTRCGVSGICDRQNFQCVPCEPGETRCDGQSLIRCEAEGRWVEAEVCEEVCHPSGCRETACVPDEYSCGATGELSVCDADGALTAFENCNPPSACDGALGVCRECELASGAYCPLLPSCPATIQWRAAAHCLAAPQAEGPITAASCGAELTQKFRLESNADQTYQLISVVSELCVGLAADASADGTGLVLAACADSADQQFSLKDFGPQFELRAGPLGKCVRTTATGVPGPVVLGVCEPEVSRVELTFELCQLDQ